MDPRQPDIRHSNQNAAFLVVVVVSLIALGITWGIASDKPWLVALVGAENVIAIGAAFWKNPQLRKGRSAAYGANSTITVILTLAILVVINFVAIRFPYKKDVTRNQLHTLSDQSKKFAQSLKENLKLTLFASPGLPGEPRIKLRPLLDNIKALNPKIEYEFADPSKDVVRSKNLGIKKQPTLLLEYKGRTSKVEEITEEKLTNAMIKISKEKTSTVCNLIGNGEHSLKSTEPDGYSTIEKAMLEQAYETKELSILLEGNIPEVCDAILLIGPSRAFLPKEIETIRNYLAQGGHAIVALEADPKGVESAPDLIKLLTEWGAQPMNAVIIDAFAASSEKLGNSGILAVVPTYSKESAITKDFNPMIQAIFPMSRPLDVTSGLPATLKARWILQTHEKVWAENDFKSLATNQVALTKDKKRGPLSVAIEISGKLKDSTAKKETKLVVFGSAQFANNQFSQIGTNRDLFMNAVSWLLDDDSLISIRKKDEDVARVDMAPTTPILLYWGLVIGMPVLIGTAGVVIWLIRRRK